MKTITRIMISILAVSAISYPKGEAMAPLFTPEKVIRIKAKKHGLSYCLVYSVAMKESRLKPNAKAYEKSVRDWSYGAMQIRWNTATKELGFSGPEKSLLNLSVNVDLGAKYLAKKLRRYKTKERAVAAYNAGSVGRVIKNKKYVNDVMRIYEECKVSEAKRPL